MAALARHCRGCIVTGASVTQSPAEKTAICKLSTRKESPRSAGRCSAGWCPGTLCPSPRSERDLPASSAACRFPHPAQAAFSTWIISLTFAVARAVVVEKRCIRATWRWAQQQIRARCGPADRPLSNAGARMLQPVRLATSGSEAPKTAVRRAQQRRPPDLHYSNVPAPGPVIGRAAASQARGALPMPRSAPEGPTAREPE